MVNTETNFSNKKQNSQSGFSLIELIIVVVIVGIVASIAVGRFNAAIMKSNEASALSAMKIIHSSQISHLAANTTPATFDQLLSNGSIDEAFADGDGDPNTGARSGYKFLITATSDSYVLSAIPQSTGIAGSGRTRLGVTGSGIIYKDDNNLTTHYTTIADLTSGTSAPFEPN